MKLADIEKMRAAQAEQARLLLTTTTFSLTRIHYDTGLPEARLREIAKTVTRPTGVAVKPLNTEERATLRKLRRQINIRLKAATEPKTDRQRKLSRVHKRHNTIRDLHYIHGLDVELLMERYPLSKNTIKNILKKKPPTRRKRA
jgi:hypothetical protein